ncbi:MAG: hypothetical protein ACP5N6_01775, partial [Anaerolineae bacterium]
MRLEGRPACHGALQLCQRRNAMTFPQLPDDLRERLRRAGVTDEESLRRALQNDPQLAADLQAFLQSNPQAMLLALLPAFLAVQTPEQLHEFWRGVPTELEQPFIALVERLIAEAPPDTPAAALESLRAKLQGFKQLCEAARLAQQIPPELGEILEELARSGVEIRTPEDLERLLQERPDLRQKLERAAPAIDIPGDLRPILQEIAGLRRLSEMPRKVELCQRALSLVRRQENPVLWAALQVELANALLQNPQGERAENLEQAIFHYQQALEVYTRQA